MDLRGAEVLTNLQNQNRGWN